MEPSSPSRRTVLKGLALGALSLPALPRRLFAKPAPGKDTPALVVVYLNGGPSGLFNSAGSFLQSGAFGVTHDNVRSLGNGLLVDAESFGTLPEAALRHMASINFWHGYQQHDLARAALLQTGSRSNLLLLAQASPTPAPLHCAVVNGLGLPVGVDRDPPREGGFALERVLELDAIGVTGARPAALAEVRAAYGLAPAATSIADAATSLCAAELLLRAGTSVIFTQPLFIGRADRQIDTHGDTNGVEARRIMATILAPLRTFVGRALALPGRDVTIALVGEFSRTVAESDHEPGGTATVIGRRVKTGTAGPQTETGGPPPGSPPVAGLWAYLATVMGLEEHPFGQNPCRDLVSA